MGTVPEPPGPACHLQLCHAAIQWVTNLIMALITFVSQFKKQNVTQSKCSPSNTLLLFQGVEILSAF
jgi:hypothetical protein